MAFGLDALQGPLGQITQGSDTTPHHAIIS
jgi:hypothetical protein